MRNSTGFGSIVACIPGVNATCMLPCRVMDTLRDMLTPEAARRSQPKGGCNLSRTLPKLTDDERELLNTALDDRETYTAVYLSGALKAQGHDISEFTIRRHRNGMCTCD